ncbi:MAG: peptidoglycan-associated lipoprotein Pal [Gammaproteobacteria bacterium]|nr:peptidoglycan-associated lipoprotein Pal [Gammaproteobacteria bacterium]
MQTSSVIKLIAVTFFMASLSGCAWFGKKPTESRKEVTGTPGVTEQQPVQEPVQTGGAGEANLSSGSSLEDSIKKAQNVFYFDFDKSIVKTEDYKDLEVHAGYLTSDPSKKVHIVGHADERGTREYNLALGERRAKAVTEVLQAQGVKQEQATVTSYGEEAPAALGHNEEAWSLNRRAEVLY